MTRVLVVDDSRTMRLRMRQMLRSMSFDVLEAEDGTDALELVEGCLSSDLPQALLVDWNMPGMTGIDLVRQLRSDTRFDDVRLMMVTSESEIERVHEALSAGVDEYLMKPFTPDQLAEKLEMLELVGGDGPR